MALARVSESMVHSNSKIVNLGFSQDKKNFGFQKLISILQRYLPELFQVKNYQAAYQSHPEQASSITSLLNKNAHEQLINLIGREAFNFLEGLCREANPSRAQEDFFYLASILPSHQLGLKVGLYEMLEQAGGSLGKQATVQRELLTGGGSFKQRFQHHLTHLKEHALNPATIGGLAVGMGIGAGVRYLSLSRLNTVSGFWSAQALGGQVLARSLAFASEVPGVVLAGQSIREFNQGPQDWQFSTLSQEIMRMGLNLFVIKGVLGSTHRAMAMAKTLGSNTSIGMVNKMSGEIMPHLGAAVGIYLAKPLEQAAFGSVGFGVGISAIDAAFEALGFGIASSFSRLSLSPGMHHALSHWRSKSYHLERGLARSVKNKLRSLGDSFNSSLYPRRLASAGAPHHTFELDGLSPAQRVVGKGGSRAYDRAEGRSIPATTKNGSVLGSLRKKLTLRSLEQRSLWGDLEAYVRAVQLPDNYRKHYERLFDFADWNTIAKPLKAQGQSYPQLRAARQIAFSFFHAWRVNAHQTGFGCYFDALLQQASIKLLSIPGVGRPEASLSSSHPHFNDLATRLLAANPGPGKIEALEQWFQQTYGETYQLPRTPSNPQQTAASQASDSWGLQGLSPRETTLVDRYLNPYLQYNKGKVPPLLDSHWSYAKTKTHWRPYRLNLEKIYTEFLNSATPEQRSLFFEALAQTRSSQVPILFLDRLTKVVASRFAGAPKLLAAKLKDLHGNGSITHELTGLLQLGHADILLLSNEASSAQVQLWQIIKQQEVWDGHRPIDANLVKRLLAIDDEGSGGQLIRDLKLSTSKLRLGMIPPKRMARLYSGKGGVPDSLFIFAKHSQPAKIYIKQAQAPESAGQAARALLLAAEGAVHEYAHYKYDGGQSPTNSDALWASEARATWLGEAFRSRVGEGSSDLLFSYPGGPVAYLLGATEAIYFDFPQPTFLS